MKKGIKGEVGYGVLCIAIMGVIFLLSPAVQKKKHDRDRAVTMAHITSTLSNWDQLVFSPTRSSDFDSTLSNSVWNSAVPLQPGQKIALMTTVRSFFDYSANPTFERFYFGRTNGGGYQFAATNYKAFSKILSNDIANGLKFEDSESTLFAAWNHFNDSNQKIGNASLDSIALDSVKVTLKATTASSIGTQAEAAKECTFVVRSFFPGIVYTNRPSSKTSHGQTNLFAQVSFVARFSPSNRATPMYAVWYWSDTTQSWRPTSMYFDAQALYSTFF